MKNLLIYLNKNKSFELEEAINIKIQVDNSLELGWNLDDLILLTNFDYEYNGLKSIIVSDDLYCDYHAPVSKINAIIWLIEKGIDDIYWFHDLDAYQLIPFNFVLTKDLATNKYGRRQVPSTGSFFFRKEALDIFEEIKDIAYERETNEEEAILFLPEDKLNRIEWINSSYNFTSLNHYKKVEKPIKVVHFHFAYGTEAKPLNPNNPKPNQIDFFLRGKNRHDVQLVPERLLKYFRKYEVI